VACYSEIFTFICCIGVSVSFVFLHTANYLFGFTLYYCVTCNVTPKNCDSGLLYLIPLVVNSLFSGISFSSFVITCNAFDVTIISHCNENQVYADARSTDSTAPTLSSCDDIRRTAYCLLNVPIFHNISQAYVWVTTNTSQVIRKTIHDFKMYV